MSPLEKRIRDAIKTFGPMTAYRIANVVGTTRAGASDAARRLMAKGDVFEFDKVIDRSFSPRPNVRYSVEPPKEEIKPVREKPVTFEKTRTVFYGGDITLLAMQSVCRARLMAREVEVI